MNMAQGSQIQLLSTQISVFPIDVDQLPKCGSARVTASCTCKAIFYQRLLDILLLRLPLNKQN